MHKIWTWRVAVEPVIAVVRAVIDVVCKAASVVYWQWTAAMARACGWVCVRAVKLNYLCLWSVEL